MCGGVGGGADGSLTAQPHTPITITRLGPLELADVEVVGGREYGELQRLRVEPVVQHDHGLVPAGGLLGRVGRGCCQSYIVWWRGVQGGGRHGGGGHPFPHPPVTQPYADTHTHAFTHVRTLPVSHARTLTSFRTASISAGEAPGAATMMSRSLSMSTFLGGRGGGGWSVGSLVGWWVGRVAAAVDGVVYI